MVLSDVKITGIPRLISPFVSSNLRRASYDLTVGDEYLISQPSDASETAPLEATQLRPQQSFHIPPFAVCYIRCKEKITLPLDVSARISLRMALINSGLMLAAQPPFDPGYSGYVIVMLHNLSNREYELTQGSRLVSMEFNEISGQVTPEIRRSDSVYTLERTLSKRVVSSLQDIEAKTAWMYKLIKYLGGGSVAYIALILGIPAYVTLGPYNVLKERVDEQKTLLETQKNTVTEQAKQLEVQKKELAEQRQELDKLAAFAKSHDPQR